MSALRTELSQLKEAYSLISAELSNLRTIPTLLPVRTMYATKTATNRQPGKPPSRAGHNRRENRQASSSGSTGTNTTTANLDNRSQTRTKSERIVVQGVRRIWGTLKSTSTTAVTSTLNKLTTLGSQLTVKKRIKPGGNHWWFLVRQWLEVRQPDVVGSARGPVSQRIRSGSRKRSGGTFTLA